ncbi:hypothetical protein BDW62DRAFT_201360 [Aspergillus aurantiobrunneus]
MRLPSLLALSLTVLLATPSSADYWAKFCSDEDCNDCGQNVNMKNTGCLKQTGRKSVYITSNGFAEADNPGKLYRLLSTPNDQCSCQSQCKNFAMSSTSTNECIRLVDEGGKDMDDALSFRFVPKGLCKDGYNC